MADPSSVPVVDLTATVRGLFERAERLRVEATELMASTRVLHTQLVGTADQLEAVAGVLGGTDG